VGAGWPLIAATLALPGLLLLAAADISRRFERTSVDNYGRTLQHDVDNAADRLSEVFEEMQKFLSLLSHTGVTIHAANPNARQLVHHVVRLLGNHGIVAGLIDGHGEMAVMPPDGLDKDTLAAVRSARNACPEPGDEICIARIQRGDRTLIVATARHSNEEGADATHVALVADWKVIGAGALGDLRPDPRSQPFLLGSDGAILTWPGGGHDVGGRLGGSDASCARCHAEREATPRPLARSGLRSARIDNVDYLIATAVATAGNAQISVGIASKQAASVAPVQPVLRNGALVLGAILLVLAFMAWWLRRDGMRRLSAVREAHAEVRRLNEVLEEKVAARTRDLETAHGRILEAKWDLAAQDRLAAVGELAATFAHEVRTPLNALSIANQRLHRALRRAGDLDPELGTAILDEQAKDVVVINDYVERYLRLARRTAKEATEVDLATLTREVFGLVRADAQRSGVRLDSDLSLLQGPLRIDRNALRHILVNLVTNAIQAQPDGGSVVVVAEMGGSGVVIEVRDEGPGLNEEQSVQAFRPFASWRSGGTGLGLSICRRFAREMHGTLTYRGGSECGAVFALDIPSDPPKEGEP